MRMYFQNVNLMRPLCFHLLIQICRSVDMAKRACVSVSALHTILLIKAYMIRHTHCVHTIIFIFFIYFSHAPWICTDLSGFFLPFIRFVIKTTQKWFQSLKKGGKISHTRPLIDFQIFLSTLNCYWYNDHRQFEPLI